MLERLGVACSALLLRVPPLRRPLGRRLARYYASQGQHGRAVAVLRQTVSGRGTADAGLLHQLGVAQLEGGDYDDAERSLRRAVVLRPDAAWSYQALGQALKAQCRPEAAETALRRAIELAPENLWAWYHLSNSLFLQGRVGAALNAVIEGCAASPFPSIPFPFQSLPAETCTPKRVAALDGLLKRHPEAMPLMALLSWILVAGRDYAESAAVMRRMAPLQWQLPGSEQTADPARRQPPAFMIIGQPVAGAGPLFRCLEQHPRYVAPLFRKCHYWSRHFAAGDDWLRACAPPLRRGSALVSGDGSTDYFSHPDAPARIAAALPDVRLILFLCDPVDRAWAQYQVYRSVGLELRGWAQVVADELAAMPVCPLDEADAAAFRGRISPDAFLWRSIALPFLKRWLGLFPREQLLILTHAALVRDPQTTLRRAIEFIGLDGDMPACDQPLRPGPQRPMPPEIEQRLRDWFAPHQATLAPLLAELGVEP